MATTTATAFHEPVKMLHAGTIVRHINYSYGSISNGDIVLLAKIPHGARVVEVIEDSTALVGSLSHHIGLREGGAAGGGSDDDCFIAAGVKGSINRLNSLVGHGLVVSLSDLATDRWAALIATAQTTTSTGGATLRCTIMYTMDESR